MEKMSKVVESVSVIVTADVTESIFANSTGEATCGNGAKARGVFYKYGALTGEAVNVVTLGIVPVTCSGAITKGNEIASDANGKAKVATGGDYVNGIAQTDGVLDGIALIELADYKI